MRNSRGYQDTLKGDKILSQWVIKSAPDHFQVRELISLKSIKKGMDYCWLWMEKENLSTLQAITVISSKLGIPRKYISWAGEKDRWALTGQYIAISRRALKERKLNLRGEQEFQVKIGEVNGKVKVKLIGWFAQPPKLQMIEGNEFKITARRRFYVEIPWRELSHNFKEALEALKSGALNYYDSQRFGSRGINHLIGYLMLSGLWREALWVFLAFPSLNETRKVRRFRRKIARIWDLRKGINRTEVKALEEILEKLPLEMDMEKSLLRAFLKTLDPKSSFKTFPQKIFKLILNALQSHYFNLELRRSLEKRLEIYRISRSILPPSESFLKSSSKPFSNQSDQLVELVKSLSLPQGLLNTDLYLPPSRDYHLKVIDSLPREIALPGIGTQLPMDFPKRELLNLKLMGSYRPSIVTPSNLDGEIRLCEDKLVEVKLSFQLPRGSYATILVKSILAML